jgi:hypothetical protein
MNGTLQFWPPARKKRARRLRTQGLSWDKIAARLGCSRNAVRRALRQKLPPGPVPVPSNQSREAVVFAVIGTRGDDRLFLWQHPDRAKAEARAAALRAGGLEMVVSVERVKGRDKEVMP